VGEILDVSFGLYRRHFSPLAIIALVCTGIPVLMNLYVEAAGGMLANLGLTAAYYVVFMALSAIATAATVFVVSDSYLGRPPEARDALKRAAPLLVRLLACSLLTAIVVGLGFLLFLLPGIVLLCGLLVAFPALVLEPDVTAMGALSRSWALTRGSRWRMFGLLVTLFILMYVPIVGLGAIAALLLPRAYVGGGLTSELVVLAVIGVVQLLLYPLLYCVLTVAYYDLRIRKEGFDLEILASTLQPV
jgi:hypothetical protein